MSSVNKRVQEEWDRIDKNPESFIDDVHREDVKHNIAVGYEIRKLEGLLHKAPTEELPSLELAIKELKATLRYNRKIEYVPIKSPLIPKTNEELRELAREYKRAA